MKECSEYKVNKPLNEVMNSKEAKSLSDSYKGWSEIMYKESAINKVTELIREACENNIYDISIDLGDYWVITKFIDHIEEHFSGLGYCVIRGYMIDDRNDVMVNIDWC